MKQEIVVTYVDTPLNRNKITITKTQIRFKICNDLSILDKDAIYHKMVKIVEKFYETNELKQTLRTSFALEDNKIVFKTDTRKNPTLYTVEV